MTVMNRANRTNDDQKASSSEGEGVLRVTSSRVLVSEWIKLRSLRSSIWCLVVIMVALVGGSAFSAVGLLVRLDPPAAEALAADPTGGAFAGAGLAQLAAIALGVLVVTGEYRSKTIRPSVTAVPSRLPLVWCKAVVAAAGSMAASLIASVLALIVASAVVATQGLSISPFTPEVARSLVGTALALGVTAALATGFGWLLRNTAGAVFSLFALLYLVPSFMALLPQVVAAKVVPFLPSNAVAAMTQVTPGAGALPAWAGLTVYLGYAVVALIAAGRVLKRHDV